MDRWRPVGQPRAALGNSDGVARGLADFAYVTLTSQGSSGAADTTRLQRAAAAIVDGILKTWKVEVSVYFFLGGRGHCLPTLSCDFIMLSFLPLFMNVPGVDTIC